MLFTIPFEDTGGDIAFSADGRMLAASCGTSAVLVEMAVVKTRQKLDKLPAPVHRLAFSPDNRLLVTALEDTTILVWDLKEVSPRSK